MPARTTNPSWLSMRRSRFTDDAINLPLPVFHDRRTDPVDALVIGRRVAYGKGDIKAAKHRRPGIFQVRPCVDQMIARQLTVRRFDGFRYDVTGSIADQIVDAGTPLRHRAEMLFEARLEFAGGRRLAGKCRSVVIAADTVGIAEYRDDGGRDCGAVNHPARVGHPHFPRLFDCESSLGKASQNEHGIDALALQGDQLRGEVARADIELLDREVS